MTFPGCLGKTGKGKARCIDIVARYKFRNGPLTGQRRA
jgi:hypothetical protein